MQPGSFLVWKPLEKLIRADRAFGNRRLPGMLWCRCLRPPWQIGVDLILTRRVEGQSTDASFIAVQPDRNKTIILATNANEAWT
ncbi:MAG: hypothetical protein ACU4EQ_09170 [Candidatus Nitrosoglobus sp.]